MSYNKTLEVKDFRGRRVELSETSWEHIQGSHPEITLNDIQAVLMDPLEVRESPKQNFVELFYKEKSHPKGKVRFQVVVVKVMKNGLFVSTAMTSNAIKKGRVLYRKGEEQ